MTGPIKHSTDRGWKSIENVATSRVGRRALGAGAYVELDAASGSEVGATDRAPNQIVAANTNCIGSRP